MNVQFYSYKVEFQQRGAAHIHGIIWLNLDKLEKIVPYPNQLDTTDVEAALQAHQKELKGIL